MLKIPICKCLDSSRNGLESAERRNGGINISTNFKQENAMLDFWCFGSSDMRTRITYVAEITSNQFSIHWTMSKTSLPRVRSITDHQLKNERPGIRTRKGSSVHIFARSQYHEVPFCKTCGVTYGVMLDPFLARR